MTVETISPSGMPTTVIDLLPFRRAIPRAMVTPITFNRCVDVPIRNQDSKAPAQQAKDRPMPRTLMPTPDDAEPDHCVQHRSAGARPSTGSAHHFTP